MKYFISGHRNITDNEFNDIYIPLLDNALLDKNASFVVGDYDGVDAMAQIYLIGKTNKVSVYHIGKHPMNNLNGWDTIGMFNDDIDRDSTMTRDSEEDIAWIRNPGDMTGTEQNIVRRNKKYYFITYQGQRKDNDSSISIWHKVIDISPMDYREILLNSEKRNKDSYYLDFYILNSQEININDYLKYKNKL